VNHASRPPRRSSNLAEPLNAKLNVYALVAGAAGVSLIALAHPAEAKIVYTPANVPITGIYNLDLNHDGITDFTINFRKYHTTSVRTSSLYCSAPNQTNQHLNSASQPEALKAGFLIGAWADSKFSNRGPRMARGGWLDSKAVFYEGHWANSGKGVRSRYLGLKFMIKGEMHYGWARFNVSFPHQTVRAVLTGYAYETIAHKAIVAGKTKGPDNVSVEESEATLTVPTRKPASLGMLAGGAPGLSIWRREKSVGDIH